MEIAGALGGMEALHLGLPGSCGAPQPWPDGRRRCPQPTRGSLLPAAGPTGCPHTDPRVGRTHCLGPAVRRGRVQPTRSLAAAGQRPADSGQGAGHHHLSVGST